MRHPGSMLAWASLVLAGCVVGEVDGTPHIAVTLENASVDCAGSATLSVEAHGVTLGDPGAGEGDAHYHVNFHDDSGDPIAVGWTSTIAAPLPVSVSPGEHELHVMLMNQDHTPLEGAEHAVVTVDVTANPCVKPSVADPVLAQGDAAIVAIEVGNFTLETPYGQPVEEGHGHYHVYFHDDTGDPIAAAADATVLAPLPGSATAGTHDLHVVLMNNDHTPIEGAAHGIVSVTVE